MSDFQSSMDINYQKIVQELLKVATPVIHTTQTPTQKKPSTMSISNNSSH